MSLALSSFPTSCSVCRERGLWNCTAHHCAPERAFCPGELVYVPGACLLTCDNPHANGSCPPGSMGGCVCPPGNVLLVSLGGACMRHREAFPDWCPALPCPQALWTWGCTALPSGSLDLGWGRIRQSSKEPFCLWLLPRMSAASIPSSVPAVTVASGTLPMPQSRRTATCGMPSPMTCNPATCDSWLWAGGLGGVGCPGWPGLGGPQDFSTWLPLRMQPRVPLFVILLSPCPQCVPGPSVALHRPAV